MVLLLHIGHITVVLFRYLFILDRDRVFYLILSRGFYVLSCGDNMVIQYLQRYFLQDKPQDMIHTRYGRINARQNNIHSRYDWSDAR